MEQLKAYIAPTPDGTCLADYYLKSEADKVITNHKYKRCLAMARICLELSPKTALLKYDKKSDLFINFYDWWVKDRRRRVNEALFAAYCELAQYKVKETEK